MSIEFKLNEKEEQTSREWIKEHRESCTIDVDAGFTAVAPHSYKFTQTGIGAAVSIECECGESVNVTDYGSW
jgi:hypothetical protein